MKIRLILLCTIFFAFGRVISLCAALPDNYNGRLCKLCKAWGYFKYNHSEVSNCKLNWDSVLLATLPQVKSATNNLQFNAVLLKMLRVAGQMKTATSATPLLDPAYSFNVDTLWMKDTSFSPSVRGIFDSVRYNFRPHRGCQVQYDTIGNGFLGFPGDKYMAGTNYPDESKRLLMFFRYWNVIHYFNPNNQIIDHPWDSTLFLSVIPIANAAESKSFYAAFLKAFSKVDDTHTQGLSFSQTSNFPAGDYMPKLAITYAEGKYVVIKSGVAGISRGDIVKSIDGLSTSQIEDSLRPYTSASNMASFHRDICPTMLSGVYSSKMALDYEDSNGISHFASVKRIIALSPDWYNFYANVASTISYKTLGCNTGYVHMGNLQLTDVNPMYDSLKNKPAIIFDIRNYPNGTAWPLSQLMLPNRMPAAVFTIPDITYPGTFYPYADSFGIDNNTDAYKGKVIILMNEETQSQAEFTCMILSLNKKVTKIGSQTAGADGDITRLKLSDDLYTGFSTLGVKYPDGTNAQRKGIVPDIVLKPTITGIRHGVDEMLNAAIQLACKTGIEQIESPASSFVLYPNPVTSNSFAIRSTQLLKTKTYYTLCDIQGKVLLGKELPLLSPGVEAIIQLQENIPNGIFYLTITNNKQVIIEKIVFLR
jgi:carboxyl-terminal processing protease